MASEDQITSRFTHLVCIPLLWLWCTSQITSTLMVFLNIADMKSVSTEAGVYGFDSHFHLFEIRKMEPMKD
jgi:hypothetical protein